MNFKNLFLIFLVSLVFMSFGCSTDSKTLSVSPSKVEFKDVNIGDYLEINVVLKNKYGKEIDINALTLTGSTDFVISSGNSLPITLQKNEEHTLTIKFEPTSSGSLYATLSILTTGSTKEKTVDISGNGIPVARINVSDMSYDFKVVKNNTTKTHDFEIENFGTSNLVLQNASFTGTGASLFSITSGGSFPVTIVPSAKHVLQVQFAPVVDGVFTATMQLDHNAVNETSPLGITLDGEGKTNTPEIALNITAPWDMGKTGVGSTLTDSFNITNNGTSPLTVSSIDFKTGTDFAFNSIEDKNGNALNLPVNVAVGDYVVAFIDFSPLTKGTLNDTMQIGHDGINELTPFEVGVTGYGQGIASFTSPGTFNWTVPAGTTTVKVLCVGGGGGGSGSHYGGGGSGYVVVKDVNVTPGATIQITVGAGGAGGISGTNISPGGDGTDSSFGSSFSATGGKGGGAYTYIYYTGGDGGSGGGGAGNMGSGGKGGSAGSNGDPGQTYAGGMGGHFDSLSGFNGNLTAGDGGAAGTSSHSGGGGAGGVLISGNGPNGGDGGDSWSGKGGKGYGSGGGSGGYSSTTGTRPGGGKGADGLVYIEY